MDLDNTSIISLLRVDCVTIIYTSTAVHVATTPELFTKCSIDASANKHIYNKFNVYCLELKKLVDQIYNHACSN